MEHRQDVVAVLPLRGRDVDLELVVEAEQLLRPPAVVDQPVERAEDRGARRERRIECLGVRVPRAAEALDHRRARATELDELGQGLGRPRWPGLEDAGQLAGPGDAERPQLPVDQLAGHLVRRRRWRDGEDALGQIPGALAAVARADGHDALRPQLLEHHRDVLAVVPAAGRPRRARRVLEGAGAARPRPGRRCRMASRNSRFSTSHSAM